VIDQLDVLLATNEKVGVTGLGDMVMGLREVCFSYILRSITRLDISSAGRNSRYGRIRCGRI
jgi:hypothetical protein